MTGLHRRCAILIGALAVFAVQAPPAAAQGQPTPEQIEIAQDMGEQLIDCAVIYQFESDLGAWQAGAEAPPPRPPETEFLLGAATFALSDILGGIKQSDEEVNRRAQERFGLLWDDYLIDEDADRVRAEWGLVDMLEVCADQIAAVSEMTGLSPYTPRDQL